MNAVTTTSLTKVYGQVKALDGLDLHVPTGSVFGLLGPNGAGKTTTIRILLGLARATSGSVTLLGNPASDQGIRARIGHVPDVPGFYGWMTATEHLEFTASLFGLPHRTTQERTGPLLDLAGLTHARRRTIGGFSRGMKQRLAIAAALVNAPDLLILDEPTSALDPVGRREVLELVTNLAGRATVLFSTHILADVERVCDHAAIIAAGRTVATGTITELSARHSAEHVIEIEVAPATSDTHESRLITALATEPWCTDLTSTATGLRLITSDRDLARRRIPALLSATDTALVRYHEAEPSLEDAFIDLIGAPQ